MHSYILMSPVAIIVSSASKSTTVYHFMILLHERKCTLL